MVRFWGPPRGGPFLSIFLLIKIKNMRNKMLLLVVAVVVILVQGSIWFYAYGVYQDKKILNGKLAPIDVEELEFVATEKLEYFMLIEHESGKFLKRQIAAVVDAVVIMGYDINKWHVDRERGVVTIGEGPKVLSTEMNIEYTNFDTWFFDGITEEDANAVKEKARKKLDESIYVSDSAEKRVNDFLDSLGYKCIFAY